MGSFFPVPSLQKRCPDHVPWQVLPTPPSEGGQVQEVHLEMISLKKARKKRKLKKICFLFPPLWWRARWRRDTGPPAQGPRRRCGTWVSCKKNKKILSLLKKYDASNTCKFLPSPPEDEESFDKNRYKTKNVLCFLNILPQSG